MRPTITFIPVVATAASTAATAAAVWLSAGDDHDHDVGQCGFFLGRSRNRMILVYT